MARITIKRPNGGTEYAELTTDKSLAGNDRLTVMKNGTKYYAKLDTGVSTHMYVLKNGRKLYVQKEVAFKWSFYIANHDYNFVIPRSGTYKLEYEECDYFRNNSEDRVKKTKELRLSAGDKPRRGNWQGEWLLGDETIAFVDNLENEDPDIEEVTTEPIRLTYLHD